MLSINAGQGGRIYSNLFEHIPIIFCLDFDECESDPCENGAECKNDENAYTCKCLDGYNGTNCEIGTDSSILFHIMNVLIPLLL